MIDPRYFDSSDLSPTASQSQRTIMASSTSASVSAPSCDHGYSTEKPDGTDDYREAMNSVMRTALTMPDSSDQDQEHEIFQALHLDLQTNFPNCWNNSEILLRKVIAAALCIVKSIPVPRSDWHTMSVRQWNQLHLFLKMTVVLENNLGRVFNPVGNLPSCPRDLSLFFIKRAPCGCFDELKRQLKGVPRTQPCNNPACRKLDSYSNHQECSRCRVRAYCSVECQKMDWPRHKEDCKVWRNLLPS